MFSRSNMHTCICTNVTIYLCHRIGIRRFIHVMQEVLAWSSISLHWSVHQPKYAQNIPPHPISARGHCNRYVILCFWLNKLAMSNALSDWYTNIARPYMKSTILMLSLYLKEFGALMYNDQLRLHARKCHFLCIRFCWFSRSFIIHTPLILSGMVTRSLVWNA